LALDGTKLHADASSFQNYDLVGVYQRSWTGTLN
jgi:hypothetical protein